MIINPRGNRLHIGFFGRRNSGKSTWLNATVGQNCSVVSSVAGTTTDPVQKSMEIAGIGPCTLFDTAGFDDEGMLGKLRIEKMEQIKNCVDIAVFVVDAKKCPCPDEEDLRFLEDLRSKNTPIVLLLNKVDLLEDTRRPEEDWKHKTGLMPLSVSGETQQGREEFFSVLLEVLPKDYEITDITGSLAKAGDIVLLVMDQDPQAPKGRLILPQVQVIRHLLDKMCMVLCVTTKDLSQALESLTSPPQLIITDSQYFMKVAELCPKESKLTSFSILFARVKGLLPFFVTSAKMLLGVSSDARILIAEACTHRPMEEDIGRVKLPRLLRSKLGENLRIDIVGGNDFPTDLTVYDLVIHCGGCMFNRKYMLHRIHEARKQKVPMTNYGVAIAALMGILDSVALPE